MSVIPGVIDRVIALCEASADLEGVQILDGPPGARTEDDVIIIGFSVDRLAVEGEATPGGLRKEAETYQLIGLASAATGGPAEFKPLRDRADSLFETVRDLIKANQKLTTGVFFAQARTTGYAQEHLPVLDPEGEVIGRTSAATFEFVITFHAST